MATDVEMALKMFMDLYQEGGEPYAARDAVLDAYENGTGPWGIEEDEEPSDTVPFVAISYAEHPEYEGLSAAETVARLLNEKRPDKHYRVENGAVVADEPTDQEVDGKELPGASGGGR